MATIAPPGPVAGHSFELAVTFDDQGSALRSAADRGALRAAVSLAYFKDHATVHEGTHLVDGAMYLLVPIEVERTGKHHVRIDLLDGDQRLARIRFDLVVEHSH